MTRKSNETVSKNKPRIWPVGEILEFLKGQMPKLILSFASITVLITLCFAVRIYFFEEAEQERS
jgi:hypothetical protein